MCLHTCTFTQACVYVHAYVCLALLSPKSFSHTCTELNFALSILLSFILGVSFFSVTIVYYYLQLFLGKREKVLAILELHHKVVNSDT